MIYIASDHGGYKLKEFILKNLPNKIKDIGPFDDKACDYPLFAKELAAKMKDGDFGILVCGTGQGMAMTANRIKGVRAVVPYDTYTAKLTREHNNANVLCLGGRILGEALALDIIKAFLKTKFSDEYRHKRRIDLVD